MTDFFTDKVLLPIYLLVFGAVFGTWIRIHLKKIEGMSILPYRMEVIKEKQDNALGRIDEQAASINMMQTEVASASQALVALHNRLDDLGHRIERLENEAFKKK